MPLAWTFALMVGTGLLTFPLGLTEAMVIAPPASVRLAPLLVPSPVWRLVWLMVRSTRFLDFGTRFYPYRRLCLLPQLLFRGEAWLKPLPAGAVRIATLLRYSPERVEGEPPPNLKPTFTNCYILTFSVD